MLEPNGVRDQYFVHQIAQQGSVMHREVNYCNSNQCSARLLGACLLAVLTSSVGCQSLPQATPWAGANSVRKPQTDLTQPMPSTSATIRGQSPVNRYAQTQGNAVSQGTVQPSPQLGFPSTTSDATIDPRSLPPLTNGTGSAAPAVPGQPNYTVPSPYTPSASDLPIGPAGPVRSAPSVMVPGIAQPQQVFQPPLGQPAVPSPGYGYGSAVAPGATGVLPSNNAIAPGAFPFQDPNLGITAPAVNQQQYGRARETVTPLDVYLQEARTGRIILGGSVNSDLGVAGQLIIDERNFNIRRFPRSLDDIWNGRAFRGEGQNFRMELMPGNRVERYTVSWTQRNLFGYLPYSLSVGGFYFTRQFRDWTEQRLGGRVALGYEVTKDLAVSSELRMEDVKIFDPRISGVQELDDALGSNDIYTARFRVVRDTRDSPFMSTRGSLLELVFDQVFGEYDFSRGSLNYSRYFQVGQRADGTGRRVIATTFRVGVTGAQTPIFENYFAGGYSTLRGFSFRGASPVESDVQVGGEFSMIGSVEYVFPLTADDMLRGVAFVDYGTVERDIEINSENFRVSPGLGIRVAVPALGPAPLAFDFAYPINHADTDDRQLLSFTMGFTR